MSPRGGSGEFFRRSPIYQATALWGFQLNRYGEPCRPFVHWGTGNISMFPPKRNMLHVECHKLDRTDCIGSSLSLLHCPAGIVVHLVVPTGCWSDSQLLLQMAIQMTVTRSGSCFHYMLFICPTKRTSGVVDQKVSPRVTQLFPPQWPLPVVFP